MACTELPSYTSQLDQPIKEILALQEQNNWEASKEILQNVNLDQEGVSIEDKKDIYFLWSNFYENTPSKNSYEKIIEFNLKIINLEIESSSSHLNLSCANVYDGFVKLGMGQEIASFVERYKDSCFKDNPNYA